MANIEVKNVHVVFKLWIALLSCVFDFYLQVRILKRSGIYLYIL